MHAHAPPLHRRAHASPLAPHLRNQNRHFSTLFFTFFELLFFRGAGASSSTRTCVSSCSSSTKSQQAPEMLWAGRESRLVNRRGVVGGTHSLSIIIFMARSRRKRSSQRWRLEEGKLQEQGRAGRRGEGGLEIKTAVITMIRDSIRNPRNCGDAAGLSSIFAYTAHRQAGRAPRLIGWLSMLVVDAGC